MLGSGDMSPEEFDRLLAWFAPDRDAAAKMYLAAHKNLTRFFQFNYCNRPEDLTDEVMNRVSKKVPPLREGLDHIAVLRGFARHVLKEYRRSPDWHAEDLSGEDPAPVVTASGIDDAEIRSRNLQTCLAGLPERDGQLLVEYYKYEPSAKIAHRQAMAKAQQMTLNALRLKVSRLKSIVEKCVKRLTEALD
jgi:DNA-directed RNA polymerase specialized sigma24 family protein